MRFCLSVALRHPAGITLAVGLCLVLLLVAWSHSGFGEARLIAATSTSHASSQIPRSALDNPRAGTTSQGGKLVAVTATFRDASLTANAEMGSWPEALHHGKDIPPTAFLIELSRLKQFKLVLEPLRAVTPQHPKIQRQIVANLLLKPDLNVQSPVRKTLF